MKHEQEPATTTISSCRKEKEEMGSKRDINSLRLSIPGRAKGKEEIMVVDMNLPADSAKVRKLYLVQFFPGHRS